jgi:hypothetical protein
MIETRNATNKRLAADKRKICSKCRVTKDYSEFGADASVISGIASWCKECKYASNARYRNNYPEKYAESTRFTQAKVRYGIDKATYERLMSEQGQKCAICRSSLKLDKNTHVDHDHSTGAVRGILCGDCNLGLGRFKDDPTILASAIDYLK